MPDCRKQEIPKDPGETIKAKEYISGAKLPKQVIDVPSDWGNYGEKWKNKNGEAVFIKKFNVPDFWVDKDLTLSLGIIDDFDSTYFNGVIIGKTDISTPLFYKHHRIYAIPGRLVRKGTNTIEVRVFDRYKGGGMLGPKEKLYIKLKDSNEGKSWYHKDYRKDFSFGDDPYRYFRW